MIITNEYNSFYFLEVRQKKKKKGFFVDLKNKLSSRERTDLFVKTQYLEEFTGIIYKTYSSLNLLQLEKIEEAIVKQ